MMSTSNSYNEEGLGPLSRFLVLMPSYDQPQSKNESKNCAIIPDTNMSPSEETDFEQNHKYLNVNYEDRNTNPTDMSISNIINEMNVTASDENGSIRFITEFKIIGIIIKIILKI